MMNFRMAGDGNPEIVRLLREPLAWTALTGGIGAVDALDGHGGSFVEEAGKNALLTLLPGIGAAGGAGLLAARSPVVEAYINERLGDRFGIGPMQSKQRAQEAAQMNTLNARMQGMLRPDMSKEQIRGAITADTRSRIKSVAGLGAGTGALLALIAMAQNERSDRQVM